MYHGSTMVMYRDRNLPPQNTMVVFTMVIPWYFFGRATRGAEALGRQGQKWRGPEVWNGERHTARDHGGRGDQGTARAQPRSKSWGGPKIFFRPREGDEREGAQVQNGTQNFFPRLILYLF